jgi:hypothetical protein
VKGWTAVTTYHRRFFRFGITVMPGENGWAYRIFRRGEIVEFSDDARSLEGAMNGAMLWIRLARAEALRAREEARRPPRRKAR